MTAPGNLICRKCGFSNVPGDQFCGSCGAFLEWEGVEPSDPAPSTALPDVPAVGPPPGQGSSGAAAVAGAAGAGAVVPPPVTPTTPRTSDTPAATSPASGALVRCPSCGIANPAGRTFCQSCGSRLPESAGVSQATSEQIAAAVSATYRPQAGSGSTPNAQPAQSGGGLLRWVIVIAVLGIVVGVAVVAATNFLKGSAASDASLNPSLGAVPSAARSGAPAGSGAPSGSAPSPAVSSAPVVSVPLALTGATASSVVGGLTKFQPSMAIDGDPKTCWQEGSPTEKGQWIEVSFASSRVTSVILTNGYNASQALYRGNLRLKDVQISVNGGAPKTVRLKDVGTPQRFEVPAVDGATKVRVTIVTTYPSVKTSVAGTPFDDAALAEIVVMGVTAP